MTRSLGPPPGGLPSACPTPLPPGERILLAHGDGARLSRRLIRDLFLDALANDYLRPLADGAVLPRLDGPVVITTDSYVVSPLFFPGGDIGALAVHGTVNDLAVCGATPRYLSLGFILEEGLEIDVLRRVVRGIRAAAEACGVLVVTGDTKVVPRGAADGMFINTTGIGALRAGVDLGPHRVRAGDRLLVSGAIGDHGFAVLAARAGFDLGPDLRSDTGSIAPLVGALIDAGIDVHFLRDPTRGGVAAVLHELREATGLSFLVEEPALPLSDGARGASELLGLDPLFVANEGKLLAVVAAADAAAALTVMQQHPMGAGAALIGEARDGKPPLALVRGVLGTTRVLDEPSGAPLPRIC